VNTWKVILATMLIFGTGVVTGGLLVRNSERIKPHSQKVPGQNTSHPTQPFSSLSPNGVRLEFLRRMERDLNLSKEQHEKIDAILAESQEHTRKLMEPISPLLREELETAREQFRAVLNAPQREVFDAMLKQQQRPREQRHPSNHGSNSSLPSPSGEPARNP
jgi:DNA-binding protein H-NS